MTKKVLDIGGMHCGACAMGIQMHLSTTDGVKTVTVDYNTKKGEVEFDENKITLERVIKCVGELGYTAKPVD